MDLYYNQTKIKTRINKMPNSSPDSKQSSQSPRRHQGRRDSSSENEERKRHSRQHRRQRSHHEHDSQNHPNKEPRSRSRQKQHKSHSHHKEKHHRNQEKQRRRISRKFKDQHSDHSDLSLYEHYFFLQDQNSKVSIETAIWSSVINFGLRPKKVLIICQNQKKINRLIKACNINRQLLVVDHDSRDDIRQLVNSYDVLLMTQEKSSITLGLDQGNIQVFDLVVNCGKTYSIEFYSLIPQFLGEGGIIFTPFDDKKQIQRHQRKLKINFKELTGQIPNNEIQKEIFNEIQFSRNFSKSLSFDQLTLLKSLPYSIQETALRLFSLLKQQYQPQTSLFCKRQGHVTFCLKTDTEFNSIKYIWNFIREQMAPSVVKNIKDMKKFENERGVLFNIPISDLSKWETFQSKIQKNDKKYKGYKLYEFLNTELPKIQDTESEEYKLLQQKKEEALKNRHQLELFIAGIPYDATEVDIRKYFSEKGINLFLIRILRDSSGFSKGIAFGLAENENHFDRAMKLNGEKFGDRQLRIKLADQKQK